MADQDPYGETRRHTETPVQMTTNEARQGTTGRPVLYVLLTGLVLAMVVWAASEMWGTSVEPPTEAQINPPTTDETTTGSTTNDATESGNTDSGAVNDTAPANDTATPTGDQNAPAEVNPTAPANP
jgi:hypothetical protein